MKNAISWFSIPAKDLKRAIKFYNAIFDFKLNESQMGGSDLAFFPIEQGGAGGHLYAAKDHKPVTGGPTLYLNGGDNLQTVLDRVDSAGGEITMQKTQIAPDMGYIASFTDSEGNRLSLYSPK